MSNNSNFCLKFCEIRNSQFYRIFSFHQKINCFFQNKEFYSETICSNCIKSNSMKPSTALQCNSCSLINLRDKGHRLQGFSSAEVQSVIENSPCRNQIDVITQDNNLGSSVNLDPSPPSQDDDRHPMLLQNTTREDHNLRDCLRFCRKFFLKLFKNHNPEIVRKRFLKAQLSLSSRLCLMKKCLPAWLTS
ncbi:unnamed protein product [Moneuplotes crassus]|uniref:Uncharacterized protein n=1 Tax=Euplotes crassus TaxID=5936 RepID=A0AAD2D5K3_EUPCR|nr:unnamed protein product [Moneuplotes crassus]